MFIKRCSFLFLFVATLFANEPKKVGVIFMYHRFDEMRYPSTSVTKAQFEAHLKYLHDNNFTVVPLSRMIDVIQNKTLLPKKAVAITIDDAYKSVYTVAYPLLKRYHYPFTIFINTMPIDHHSKAYVSWDDLRAMQKSGLVEFGNHTKSHPYLLKSSHFSDAKLFEALKREIEGAQKRIQEELGASVNTNPKMFVYPFGEYDNRIKRMVQKLGYVGISQVPGPLSYMSDLGALPRFPMAYKFAKLKSFALKANTQPFPLQSSSYKGPVIKQNPPHLHLKLAKKMWVGCYKASGEKLELLYHDKKHLDLEIVAKEPLTPPRDHYTCTAKAKDGWYWKSFFWVFAR